MGFKLKYKIKTRAGSSGDGGGGEASPQPPPTLPPLPRLHLVPPRSPSGENRVISISPLPLPPLPRRPPADEDTDEEGELDDEDMEEQDWEEEDWEEEDWEEEEEEEIKKGDEEMRKPSESKFCCLLMSVQRHTPDYIVRYDSVPLNKHIYLSLCKQWRKLLAGKRTYLRPPRDHCVLNDVFKCPDPRPRTLGCQEPLSALIHESAHNRFIQQKIKLLSEQYAFVRRTRRDSSSFYRGFFFSYMENLGQMQDSQAEITRLMGCVAMSLEKLSGLQWDKAYFLNPIAYFSSVVSEFEHLVKSVANGLSADDLYKRNLQEIMSSRILSFLRLLTEIEIRTREKDYTPFSSRHKCALEFCLEMVRPMDTEADIPQIRALSNALGIPLRIEVADSRWQPGVVQVERQYFFPRSEPGVSTTLAPVHSSKSYSSPSTSAQTLEQRKECVSIERAGVNPSGNLLSSDGIPLVTLVYRPGHYDILYLK